MKYLIFRNFSGMPLSVRKRLSTSKRILSNSFFFTCRDGVVELGVCFFFHAFAMESLTAPVSLPYPSNDENTKFTMDPGLISSGWFLKYVSVCREPLPEEPFAILPGVIYSVRVRVPEARLSLSHSRRCGSCSDLLLTAIGVECQSLPGMICRF